MRNQFFVNCNHKVPHRVHRLIDLIVLQLGIIDTLSLEELPCQKILLSVPSFFSMAMLFVLRHALLLLEREEKKEREEPRW